MEPMGIYLPSSYFGRKGMNIWYRIIQELQGQRIYYIGTTRYMGTQ